MMKKYFNKYVAKRRELIVNESDVTGVLDVINNNISIWHQSVRVGKCCNYTWYIYVHATNDEWGNLATKLRTGGFKKILHKRKGYSTL